MAKASFWQDLLWRAEAAAYDGLEALARAFPIETVSDFGAWLASTVGPLTSIRRTVETNLRIAFPEASDAEIDRLMAEQWDQIGRWGAEFPILDRIVADPSRVEVVGAERLAAIRERGEPVVFISGHFSSFEIMSAVILKAGITCWITGRATNNPYVNDRILRSRRRYGVERFAPKGAKGTRDLMHALARGESVALMTDQKFNGGVEAPLFGVMCHTAPGAATFALRYGAPLQPMSVQRVGRVRFRVFVHDPIVLQPTGDRDADVEAGVRRINAFIEDRVRARPAEWFWVHKRWPNEVYKRERA